MATGRFTGAMVSQMIAPKSSAGCRPDLVARGMPNSASPPVISVTFRYLGYCLIPIPRWPHFAARSSGRSPALRRRTTYRCRAQLTVTGIPTTLFRLRILILSISHGGHAPMVDFRDSSWLGEIINLAYEHKVVLSLICHATIAIASAALHIDECSSPCAVPDYPFRGAKLTTVSKFGGLIALTPTSQRSLARSLGCRNISTKS